jgi:cytochrome c
VGAVAGTERGSDFDADGEFDATEPNPEFTYTERGVYNATLKLSDRTGRSAAAAVEIIVGNRVLVDRGRAHPEPVVVSGPGPA